MNLLFKEEDDDFLNFTGVEAPPADDKAKEEADKKKKEVEAAAELEKKNKEKVIKDKPTQIREIADAKKRLEEENLKLKEENEKISALKVLYPVKEYLEKKFGKVDKDTVTQFIDKGKARKTEIEELKKKDVFKEEKLKELDILYSEEWIEDYAKPLQEAQHGLTATIAELDKEEKIKHPAFFSELNQKLLKIDDKGNALNAVQIKSVLQMFARDYKEKTGEEYTIPRINDVVDSVNLVVSRFKKSIDAKQNWQKSLEDKRKEKAFDEDQKNKVILERDKQAKEALAQKAADDFDFKSNNGIFEEEHIKEKINGVHSDIILMSEGKQKKLQYNETVALIAQARLYPELLEKFRKLQVEFETEFKKKHSGLGAGSSDRLDESDKNKGKLRQIDDDASKNPMEFLKV